MSKVHGTNFEKAGTQHSRGDLQCDGRLVTPETIYACYGPVNAGANATEASMRTAVAKVRSDFEGARKNWPDMQEWVFVTNYLDTPAQILQEIAKLRKEVANCKIVMFGKEAFERLLSELEVDDIEDLLLADLTDEDFRNVEAAEIVAVVNDIMANVGVPPEIDEPPKEVPSDKLDFNGLSSAIRGRIGNGFAGTPLVKRILKDHPDPMVPIDLAAAFKAKYLELDSQGFEPGDIMDDLYEFTMSGRRATTAREVAVWTVLAHFFEACTIFKDRPVMEKVT